jgi:hypothetical protein
MRHGVMRFDVNPCCTCSHHGRHRDGASQETVTFLLELNMTVAGFLILARMKVVCEFKKKGQAR